MHRASAGADVVALVGWILLVGYPLIRWGALPARVPTHFDLSGSPDEWGGRMELLILPLVGTAIFAGLTVFARFPYIYNYAVTITPANASYQYGLARRFIAALKAEIVWLFAFLEWGSVEVALGERSGLGGLVVAGSTVAILASVAGYVLLSLARR